MLPVICMDRDRKVCKKLGSMMVEDGIAMLFAVAVKDGKATPVCLSMNDSFETTKELCTIFWNVYMTHVAMGKKAVSE